MPHRYVASAPTLPAAPSPISQAAALPYGGRVKVRAIAVRES